jgi:hypothetical protein
MMCFMFDRFQLAYYVLLASCVLFVQQPELQPAKTKDVEHVQKWEMHTANIVD